VSSRHWRWTGPKATLKLAPDEQELKCLLQPDALAPVPNRRGAQGWTTVRLAAVGVPELEGALGLAWRRAQPRGRRTKKRETSR
jgi:hypothetical protein